MSPYRKPGRLADVIAALQVMGAAQRPEGEIKQLTKTLSYNIEESYIVRWNRVFTEHPEFFLSYKLNNEQRYALRWRYTNKLYNHRTGKLYTPEEKDNLSKEEQWALTTKPLSSEAIASLIKTAIELHHRAIMEEAANRWWMQLVAPGAAILGTFIGAIGGFLSGCR